MDGSIQLGRAYPLGSTIVLVLEVAVPHEKTSEWTLWVVAVSCALHVGEEYLTGWQEWARQTLGIVMPTTRFLVANAVLVVVALLLARVGWRQPALALVIPSATLVNAVFFHILPTILQHRASPGIYTAALLYVPFSSWALIGAARDGVARTAIATGLAAGSGMMASVVLGARALSAN
jgi:hypothetical protein